MLRIYATILDWLVVARLAVPAATVRAFSDVQRDGNQSALELVPEHRGPRPQDGQQGSQTTHQLEHHRIDSKIHWRRSFPLSLLRGHPLPPPARAGRVQPARERQRPSTGTQCRRGLDAAEHAGKLARPRERRPLNRHRHLCLCLIGRGRARWQAQRPRTSNPPPLPSTAAAAPAGSTAAFERFEHAGKLKGPADASFLDRCPSP